MDPFGLKAAKQMEELDEDWWLDFERGELAALDDSDGEDLEEGRACCVAGLKCSNKGRGFKPFPEIMHKGPKGD